jgi:hypothetical protein|tara:strand:+ start:58 stop:390 length:333 start_codon:yes stop_codon:yes gene_type:complete
MKYHKAKAKSVVKKDGTIVPTDGRSPYKVTGPSKNNPARKKKQTMKQKAKNKVAKTKASVKKKTGMAGKKVAKGALKVGRFLGPHGLAVGIGSAAGAGIVSAVKNRKKKK